MYRFLITIYRYPPHGFDEFEHPWMKGSSSKIREKLMFTGYQKTLCLKWPKESVIH